MTWSSTLTGTTTVTEIGTLVDGTRVVGFSSVTRGTAGDFVTTEGSTVTVTINIPTFKKIKAVGAVNLAGLGNFPMVSKTIVAATPNSIEIGVGAPTSAGAVSTVTITGTVFGR